MIPARWAGVVLATFLAVPLAGALVALLARRRRGQPGRWVKSAAEVGLVLGTAPWLWMILTPSGTGRSVELVPFVGLFEQIDGGTAVVQIGGNLLVFAAFGFCARLRWGWSVGVITALAAAASLSVEILQYVLDIGRVSSIDDVLLNALGAAITAMLAVLLARETIRAAPDRR